MVGEGAEKSSYPNLDLVLQSNKGFHLMKRFQTHHFHI